MTARLPHITDHALLRYLERVLGVDVEGARAELTDRVRNAVAIGATSFTVQGTKFVFDGAKLITVQTSGARKKKARPARLRRSIPIADLDALLERDM